MGRREREQLDRLADEMRELKSNSELLKTILMIREPETTTAATAYEGLRKQIIATAGERRAHLTQLAQMDAMLHHTDDVASLRRLSEEWMAQAGVVKLWSIPNGNAEEELFEILEKSGPVFRVSQPAYIDDEAGRVLRLGRAAYVAAEAEPETEGKPIEDPAATASPDSAEHQEQI